MKVERFIRPNVRYAHPSDIIKHLKRRDPQAPDWIHDKVAAIAEETRQRERESRQKVNWKAVMGGACESLSFGFYKAAQPETSKTQESPVEKIFRVNNRNIWRAIHAYCQEHKHMDRRGSASMGLPSDVVKKINEIEGAELKRLEGLRPTWLDYKVRKLFPAPDRKM